jgi:ribosome-binding protein aMBF1 (putative translation factor)
MIYFINAILAKMLYSINDMRRPGQKNFNKDVARAIAAARTHAGVTQIELAKRMRTTQTAIARLESGRVAPNTSTLQRFAEAIERRLIIEFQETSTPQSSHRKG